MKLVLLSILTIAFTVSVEARDNPFETRKKVQAAVEHNVDERITSHCEAQAVQQANVVKKLIYSENTLVAKCKDQLAKELLATFSEREACLLQALIDRQRDFPKNLPLYMEILVRKNQQEIDARVLERTFYPPSYKEILERVGNIFATEEFYKINCAQNK